MAEASMSWTLSGAAATCSAEHLRRDLEEAAGLFNPVITCKRRPEQKPASKMQGVPDIKRVVFNDPATIILWADGTKTVVKVTHGEEYIPEVGFAMCILKKLYGTRSNYLRLIDKYLPKAKEDDEAFMVWTATFTGKPVRPSR